MIAALIGLTFSAGLAHAQTTPSDVRDLVGARAAGGESELAARGYVNVGARSGDDRKWTYWWNERRGVCLSVTTMNGRYDAIVATPTPDCRASGGGYRSPQADRDDAPPFRANYDDYREHIALICYGEGEKYASEYTSGYEWDRDKKRYVQRSGTQLTRKDYDTSVRIQIDGDVGRIQPAKNMIPPLHSDSDGGWYPINGLSISRDTIRGEFKFNGANRPKLMIDRLTGHIILDGLTKFHGTCTPLDADRRF
ncbi:hypothetical protein B7G68_00910 [Caulobacter segnis]|nr:hypothetical protein B7G68_00910 [Caulobacter segnis]